MTKQPLLTDQLQDQENQECEGHRFEPLHLLPEHGWRVPEGPLSGAARAGAPPAVRAGHAEDVEPQTLACGAVSCCCWPLQQWTYNTAERVLLACLRS